MGFFSCIKICSLLLNNLLLSYCLKILTNLKAFLNLKELRVPFFRKKTKFFFISRRRLQVLNKMLVLTKFLFTQYLEKAYPEQQRTLLRLRKFLISKAFKIKKKKEKRKRIAIKAFKKLIIRKIKAPNIVKFIKPEKKKKI